MKSTFVITAMAMMATCSQATEIYNCESNGKHNYQNWPCNTKPTIERPPKEKPDYSKAVDCGFKSGIEGTTAALTGQSRRKVTCDKNARP